MFLIIILIILVLLVVVYWGLTLYVHDKSVKDLNINNLKVGDKTNILFIYPHPDDETMNAGGLIHQLISRKDFNVFAVSATAGEKGDEILKLSEEDLDEVRKKEFEKVMNVLGVKNREVWKFNDGQLTEQKEDLKRYLKEFILQNNINVLVSFEKYGVYGHPDHITLSSVVNEVSKELKIKSFYSTLPDKILNRVSLPKTLTYKDKIIPLSKERIADPEFKVNVTGNVLTKYMAVRNYKSQNLTGGSMPLWFMIAMTNYEYLTSKYE